MDCNVILHCGKSTRESTFEYRSSDAIASLTGESSTIKSIRYIGSYNRTVTDTKYQRIINVARMGRNVTMMIDALRLSMDPIIKTKILLAIELINSHLTNLERTVANLEKHEMSMPDPIVEREAFANALSCLMSKCLPISAFLSLSKPIAEAVSERLPMTVNGIKLRWITKFIEVITPLAPNLKNLLSDIDLLSWYNRLISDDYRSSHPPITLGIMLLQKVLATHPVRVPKQETKEKAVHVGEQSPVFNSISSIFARRFAPVVAAPVVAAPSSSKFIDVSTMDEYEFTIDALRNVSIIDGSTVRPLNGPSIMDAYESIMDALRNTYRKAHL